MSSSSLLLCDACGLPPKPNSRLHKCARCGVAYYHDAHCQKMHYPQHKMMCRRTAADREEKKQAVAAAEAVKVMAGEVDAYTEPLTKCQTITGKGRALVATSELTVGCHPLARRFNNISDKKDEQKDNGLCAPLVQPTLFESMRKSRCSYCFQTITTSKWNSKNSFMTYPRLHVHCSNECQMLDTCWKGEQYASMKLFESHKITSLPSPTVLTCCRIFRSSLENPNILTEYNELCYKDDDNDDKDYDNNQKSGQEDDHLRIIAQCHQLLLIMGETSAAKAAHDLLDPNPRLSSRFISRLAMNGFTICNSEQEALGVGVYPRASMINHSCRPNAVQSFWLSNSETRRVPPMLQITVCRNAKIGEEVTISYCDATILRYDRRKTLKKNYNFCCECKLCQDLERDDALIGLRCPSHKCKGRVKTSSSGAHEMAYIKRQYSCDECGRSNFDEVLGQDLSRLQARIIAIENKLKDGSDHKEAGAELLGHFNSVLFLCYRQTSWYLAKLCDMYVNWCSNALGFGSNEEEQLEMCNDALSLINESRDATEFSYDYEGSLTYLMKRGTEAKLRLFVNPTDFEALAILTDVKRDLMRYYPSSDEVLVSLAESIHSYSFS